MTRRRRSPPVFEVEYATLPPRKPKRDKRRAKREKNRLHAATGFDAPREANGTLTTDLGAEANGNSVRPLHRDRGELEDAPRLRLTRQGGDRGNQHSRSRKVCDSTSSDRFTADTAAKTERPPEAPRCG